MHVFRSPFTTTQAVYSRARVTYLHQTYVPLSNTLSAASLTIGSTVPTSFQPPGCWRLHPAVKDMNTVIRMNTYTVVTSGDVTNGRGDITYVYQAALCCFCKLRQAIGVANNYEPTASTVCWEHCSHLADRADCLVTDDTIGYSYQMGHDNTDTHSLGQ